MSARLERIARMSPDDREMAVLSFIEGAWAGSDGSTSVPVLNVTYRRSRSGQPRTETLEVLGVATNDNGTSTGELIVRPGRQFLLHGIALAHLDALETTP
jgi:hypothetical protein